MSVDADKWEQAQSGVSDPDMRLRSSVPLGCLAVIDVLADWRVSISILNHDPK
jgi:hypothetical protein